MPRDKLTFGPNIPVMKIGRRPIDLAKYLVEKAYEDGSFFDSNNSRFNWRHDRKLQICSKIAFTADGPKVSLPLKWNNEAAQKTVEEANAGDRQADAVLREIATEFLERSVELPPELRDHVIKLLRIGAKPLRKQKNPHGKILRDRTIIAAVEALVRYKKLRPTRSPASSHESACSVVAEAAGMKEGAVNKIWEHRPKRNTKNI